jgi:hypothetical protein
MNTVIFITEHTKRPQYLAVCQCGRRHGPYRKVAMIPPVCPACDEGTCAKERHANYGGERYERLDQSRRARTPGL